MTRASLGVFPPTTFIDYVKDSLLAVSIKTACGASLNSVLTDVHCSLERLLHASLRFSQARQ